MVAEALALLVTSLMLLIDDDDAELGEGREHRRAGADDDADLAADDGPPGIVALSIGKARMQNGDPGASRGLEPGAEAPHQLGGERNLGDEHQRPSPSLENAGDGLQIDFGLAAAGDAVQQKGGEAALLQNRLEGRKRLLLLGGGDYPPVGGHRLGEEGVAPPLFITLSQISLLHQALERGMGAVETLAQFGQPGDPALADPGHDFPLPGAGGKIGALCGGKNPLAEDGQPPVRA